jgi:predicted small metal-binding protein
MTITCDCGFEARAADEGGLVAEVRRHAAEAHGMELSDDEARALVFRSERESSTTAHRGTEKEES